MNFLRTGGCICLFTLLGGCAVYTPRPVVVVEPAPHPVVVVDPMPHPVVVVEPGVIHGPSGRGRFCPPGQAKKGNC